jgi:hypothetical protein
MARLLKRWESPRREGRNDKGRGGSARQRQLKKQQKMLMKKLKGTPEGKDGRNSEGREINLFLFLLLNYRSQVNSYKITCC